MFKLVIRYGQAGPFRLSIGPDPVGPDLVLLKVAFQRFAVEGMLGGTRKQGHSGFPVVAGGWQERRSPESRGPAEARPGPEMKNSRMALR